MHKTPILLIFFILAVMLSTGNCDIAKIPASKAVYIDIDSLRVHKDTGILKCTIQNEVKAGNISASLIQFNISGLNFSNSDIGILVLKVADVSKRSNTTNLVVLMPMGSDWSDNSSSLSIIANMEPLLRLIEKKDLNQMEVSTNDGQLFDVSKILKESKGDRVSFLLIAFSDRNYTVEFKSPKSDAGPYLLVMPYPLKDNTQFIGT